MDKGIEHHPMNGGDVRAVLVFTMVCDFLLKKVVVL